MNSNQLADLSKATRLDLWVEIINRTKASTMLEVGVWKGDFSHHILANCPSITRYYMRRSLGSDLIAGTNPFNVEQKMFDDVYAEAMARTDFAKDRRVVLRGCTVDVIEQIPDRSLDLAYIDADHTLRGVSIDMIRSWAKVRPGGILGGDDYSRTMWQHPKKFEPTLVCPFAAYFAESAGTPLVIFPQNQFAMLKPDGFGTDFRVIDTTGLYGEPTILQALAESK